MEDPYIWLESIDDPKVIKWVDSENVRLREFLGVLPGELRREVAKYVKIPYLMLVKVCRKGYFALFRRGSSFEIVLIGRDGSRRKILDSRSLGKDVVLKWFYIDDEGERLAYTFSYAGSDVGITRIVDTKDLEIIDELKGVVGDITWIDKERYYYVRFYREGETPDGVKAPTERVFLREGGKDVMVFGEGIPQSYFISLSKSTDSSKALVAVFYGSSWSNIYGGNLRDPDTWVLVYGKSKFMTYPIDYVNGKYYVLSHDDRRGLGRVVEVGDGLSKVVIKAWRYPLRDAVIVGNHLVAHYLVNASSILKVYTLSGKLVKRLRFRPPGTLSSFSTDGKELVFKYESFIIPYRLYRLVNGSVELIGSKRIRGDYIVTEGWVRSKDGTPIHIFIIERRGCRLGKAVVYGYGGFSIGLTPRYYHFITPFINRCGTFVVTNLRGGDEFGEEWHKAGMREKKQNVFNDFIAIIEYLRSKGYSVVALGSSNGGLLVGAVLTQRPEILDGAVIGYPVLDMLRFHKLYIGSAWIPEYGNPDDPRDREYLLKYSPYHNVKKVQYPPTLVFTGLHDDRVHPGHAFKFVAKLKEVNAPVFLRTEKLSGHSGATPDVKVREYSDILAFIFKVFKLNH
ncbi:MAG: peptidase S9 [Desulfurococcales archaeon ex4484_42]|nr:MAG: peptidase S9 [Desulfurococcales archaeon ex4484_42]